MEAVLDEYEKPHGGDHQVRLCVDEQPVQLLGHKTEPKPPAPGQVAKHDYEYVRCGTAVVFIAYDMDRGQRYTKVCERRTKRDYAQFIDEVLATHYGAATEVVIVQDNLNTHTKGAFYEHLPLERAGWLNRQIRFVFTPKHGSWLNMAEIEFSSLTRQCVGGRRINSLEELSRQVAGWTKERNEFCVRISWSFTVDHARQKLAHKYKKAQHTN